LGNKTSSRDYDIQEVANLEHDPSLHLKKAMPYGWDGSAAVALPVDSSGNIKIDPTNIDTRYLLLDQTTPQTITASPIFNWLTASQAIMTDADKKLVSVDYLNQAVKTTSSPTFFSLSLASTLSFTGGSNTLSLTGQANAGDKTITLPDATGTVALTGIGVTQNWLTTGTLSAGAGMLTSLNTHTIPAGTGTLALTSDVSGLLSSANTWTNTNNFTGSLVVANSTTYVYFDFLNALDSVVLWKVIRISGTESQLNAVPDADWGQSQDKDTYGADLAYDDGTYFSGMNMSDPKAGEWGGMMWQWQIPTGIDETNVKGLYVQAVGYYNVVQSELKIYNWSTSTWDSVATGTSTSSDNDMNGTITSNVGNYINNNQVSFQMRTKTSPPSQVTHYYDYVKFGYLADVELDNQKWLGDLTVDGNFYVNGVYRPKSLVPLADDTYYFGSDTVRWKYGYFNSLTTKYLDVTGNTGGIGDWQVYFHGDNLTSPYALMYDYVTSRSGSTQIKFLWQRYKSTGYLEETDTIIYGDYLEAEKEGNTMAGFSLIGRASIGLFNPTATISLATPFLIVGGYSKAYGVADGACSSTVNFISHIFDIPTATDDDGSFSGTKNLLSWFSQGDATFASGKKLYFRGSLSGRTLTLDTTEYVNSDADGYLDLHAGTAVRANTGFIIPVGTTPTPAVAGALYVDTDASANGDLMVYANSAWRKVVSLP